MVMLYSRKGVFAPGTIVCFRYCKYSKLKSNIALFFQFADNLFFYNGFYK